MNLLRRVTGPSVSPVTLAECKRDLRILSTDHDMLIAELIAAAVAHVDGPEGVLGHALISQTWRVTRPRWSDHMHLPFAPVQRVVALRYYDAANVQRTFAPANYALHGDNQRAWIEVLSATNPPSIYDRDDAVSIEFVAGYGAAASDVPAGIRHLIRILVAHWFEHPTPYVIGSMTSPISHSYDMLVATYRQGVVG